MFIVYFNLRPMTQFNDRVTIYQYMDATTSRQTRLGLESELLNADRLAV